MNRFIFSISFILLALGKCECEKDSLTDYDGMGGIESKVDGEFFRPSGGGINGNNRAYFDLVDENYLLILSYSGEVNSKSSYLGLIINSIDPNDAVGKTFILEEETENKSTSYATFSSIEQNFKTTEVNQGEFTFDFFDLETGIISGRFRFTAEDTNGEIVTVTEGKFDMDFK